MFLKIKRNQFFLLLPQGTKKKCQHTLRGEQWKHEDSKVDRV